MAKKDRIKYDYETLKKEREYGFYWYSPIWRVLRTFLILFISIILSFGLLSLIYKKFHSEYISPVNLDDNTEINFTVESGSSLSKVSKNLEKEGLIRNSTVFKYYSDFMGLGQKIQAGDYILRKNMTLNEIANNLASGDGKPLTLRFTIIPGQTIESVAENLHLEGIIGNKEEFLSLCKDGKQFENYYFISDVIKTSNSANRKYILEGYLAPNTYEIYTNSSTKTIINRLLQQTDSVFSSTYHDRANELKMTMDEILTLASIIEKEAKTDDFSKVSAIFHNRLKSGMKLQSDVTIHYVTNVRRMLLKNEDLNINSGYNTYMVNGLPLGPICNPSPNAIYAALFPDEDFIKEKYLYFCSKDPNTGELYFSKTLKDHEQAVKIFAPLWDAFDKSRGLN